MYKISEKWYDLLLGRIYVTGNSGYQNFLVFAPVFNPLKLHSNEKVTNWISTGISSEKIKAFDTNLKPSISNFANGRLILKVNNSALVQKCSSLLYTSFVLNLYIVYEV